MGAKKKVEGVRCGKYLLEFFDTSRPLSSAQIYEGTFISSAPNGIKSALMDNGKFEFMEVPTKIKIL